MKKSLIALAALATVATVAQAQSSVTVYGVLDAGFAHLSNTAGTTNPSWNGMAQGGLSTSRFGFKGTEDLGSGLKANFVLESQFFPSNGLAGADVVKGSNVYSSTVNGNTLFSRQSTLGLEGSFGRVDIGRANTIGYDKAIQFDPMGYGNFGAIGSLSPTVLARANNQVKYYSPTVSGVQLGLAYSTAGVAGEDQAGNTQEVAVTYANGGLQLLATYAQTKTLTTTGGAFNSLYSAAYGANTVSGQGNNGISAYQLGAIYTMGAFKFNLGFDSKKDVSAMSTLISNQSKQITYGGVAYTINPVNVVTLAYYDYKNKTVADSAGNKSQMIAAKYVYSLSKRTDVYGIAARVNNDAGVQISLGDNSNIYVPTGAANVGATPEKGKDQTGVMVGIRHLF